MVTVRITQVNSTKEDQGEVANFWKAAVSTGDKNGVVDVVNPFSNEQEKDVHWYMEDYVNNPYEVSKAAKVSAAIKKYAAKLASTIASTGIIPRKGDLELEIELEATRKNDGGSILESQFGRSVLTLRWEILEDPSIWPKGFNHNSVTVKRTFKFSASGDSLGSAGRVKWDAVAQVSTFNILLVISRPKGREDIEYQLVSRRLVDALDQVRKETDVKVLLTVLRPPTWQAFKDHLLLEVPPGHYHLVHFDMHGKITTSKSGEVRANLRFSRYIEGQEIFFTKGLLKPAQEVAAVLNEAKVPCVIANACDSASTAHDSTAGNLAEVFIRSGIPFVLAMSYQIIDNAVEIFMERFYHSLLVQGTDVCQSAHDARQALLNCQERRARFLQKIGLVDYFVPVCYQDGSIPPLRISFGDPKGKSGILAFRSQGAVSRVVGKLAGSSKQPNFRREEMLRIQASVSRVMEKFSGSPKQSNSGREEILGRDYNILEMEHILKLCQKLLLHGQGGCGKTSLLKYCEWWWKKTGLINDSYFFDFATLLDADGRFEDLLAGISKALSLPPVSPSEETILDEFRKRSVLLVFDSMETLDSPGFWQKARFPPVEQEKLWTFLNRACRGNTCVVFSSRVRTIPTAESVPGVIPYSLSGLSVSAAALLAEQVIRAKSPSDASKLETRESIDYLRRVFILLEGNPEAIKGVLPNLWKKSLSTQSLFELLLVGVCPLDEEISQNSRFLKTIRSVNAELELFAAFGSDLIIPWQLFPFWNIMPCDLRTYFYFFYWKMGALEKEFADERPHRYCFSKYFEADVGIVNIISKTDESLDRVVKKLTNAGIIHDTQVSFEDEAIDEKLYHLHPLFTLCAREMVPEEFLDACVYAFCRQQSLWGKTSLAGHRKSRSSSGITNGSTATTFGTIKSQRSYSH